MMIDFLYPIKGHRMRMSLIYNKKGAADALRWQLKLEA